MTGMVQQRDGNVYLNRLAPEGPMQAYKTYGAAMPIDSHWVSVTCEEFECEFFLNGWSINVAPLSEQDRAAINAFGYRYRVLEVTAEETLWLFEPGQPCFKSSTHRVQVRPPTFYTRAGDWRGDPTGQRPYVHDSAENWVDDMATHLDRIRAAQQKG